jgi:sugar/nucleoside kinase (ribokinase family)
VASPTEAAGPVLGVLGDLVEDVIVWQRAPLAIGSDTPSRVVCTQGGSAANTAVQASALVNTRFIGCVGDDEPGRAVARALRLAGVDTRLATGSRTGVIVVLVDPAGERTMLPDRGANSELTEAPAGSLDGLDALHVTAYSLQSDPTAHATERALALVRENGGLTSLDASSESLVAGFGRMAFRKLVECLDPDIVFANAAEAALLRWDAAEPSPRLLVVKHGGDPVLVRTAKGAAPWAVPTVSDVVDTTGAGDAFAAGFLGCLLRRWDAGASGWSGLRALAPDDPLLRTACAKGHELAARVMTRLGAGRPL